MTMFPGTFSDLDSRAPERESFGGLFLADRCKKKPTGCLLGACSGQHPVGYRFSLLTLLFSGVIEDIKPQAGVKFRLFL